MQAIAVSAIPLFVPQRLLGKNSPANTIQIGQIGCGRIAREHDLLETLKYDHARIVAVCDLDTKRAQEGKQFVQAWYQTHRQLRNVEVKVYHDYQELLADPTIDAVMISTPDHWHAQPAIEAALAGKDIYLQKPTSLTIVEGRQLSDVIHRSGRILQIGSQQRSMPQFRIACELVRNGRVGNLQTIKIGLPGDPSGEEEAEMPIPANLNYEKWLGSTPFIYYTEKRVHPQHDYSRPGWLRCEQFGAGMITGWGAHHLDTANWGMGTEYTGPVQIEAEAEFPRSGLWDVHGPFEVQARFANGVVMMVSGEFPNGVRFEGDEGWIFVTRGDYAVTVSDPAAVGNQQALSASDPKLISTPLPDDAVRLHVSESNMETGWRASRRADPPLRRLKSAIAPVQPVFSATSP